MFLPWLLFASSSQAQDPEDTERISRLAAGERLRSTAVFPGSRPPRVVWTWTTPDQIAMLREGGRLLHRTESPTYGPAAFDRALRNRDREDPIAVILNEQLRYRRFAWTQPWATGRGWRHESWGTELLRVELQPDAWMVIYDRRPEAKQRLRVVDADGNAVSLEQVQAEPHRIGLVLHTTPTRGEEPRGMWDTFSFYQLGYRELVLCNEAMVASWSYGTREVWQEVARSKQTLRAIAPVLSWKRESEFDWSHRLIRSWSQRPADLRSLYLANLALTDHTYRPDPAAIDEVVAFLDGLRFGAPLHRPP